MNREQIAQAYSDRENGLEPLSWGRIKVLVRLAPAIMEEFPQLAGETGELEVATFLESVPDLGDLVIATYLMPFSKFRTLSKSNYKDACEEFSGDVPAEMVAHCIDAIARDWKAVEASIVEAFDQGKKVALPAGPNHSEGPY